MRLLLEENLSPRLVERLGDLFPGSGHVRELGLIGKSDATI
jgi:predicted nuclease of predicted toxin-antitoxin system